MTEYKNERNHKKLLVPIIALILCATAMIGLGYAALTSTVTNQANVVAVDGLYAELRDGEDGSLLEGAKFSEGADKFNYGSIQVDLDMKYNLNSATDMKLGSAYLFIKTINSDVTSVEVTYTVTFTEGSSDLITSHKLIVTAGEEEITGNLSVDDDGKVYKVTLLANVDDVILDVPPSDVKYNITITLTPVE